MIWSVDGEEMGISMTNNQAIDDELLIGCEGGILTIQLNIPDKLNAITTALVDRITSTVNSADQDPQVRVLVLTGTGRAFCAGANLAAKRENESAAASSLPATGPDPESVDAVNALTHALTAVNKPVICAMNGLAAGVGVSMALACDLILARDDAYFLLAFTRVGLMPDGGSSQLVAASLGRSRALQLALLAQPLTTKEAHQAGLVWSLHSDEESLRSAVAQIASQLAAGPTRALGETKSSINAATLGGLDAAMTRERAVQGELLQGPEYAEGMAAQLAKRPAVFHS